MQHISAKPVGHITAHEHNLIYALYADARENKSRCVNPTLPKLLVHFTSASLTKPTLAALLYNASWS